MNSRLFLLEDFLNLLNEQKWRLLCFTLLGMLGGYLLAHFVEENYEASTEILIGSNVQGDVLSSSWLQTYKEIVGSAVLLDEVNTMLGTDFSRAEYERIISLHSNENSRLISITATYKEEAMAMKLVDAVAKAYEQQMIRLSSELETSILQDAKILSSPAGNFRAWLMAFIGGILLFLAVFLYGVFLEVYRPKLNTASKANELDLQVIAEIPSTKYILSRKKRMQMRERASFYAYLVLQKLWPNHATPILLASHKNIAARTSYVNVMAHKMATEKTPVLLIQFQHAKTMPQADLQQYSFGMLSFEQLISKTKVANVDQLVLAEQMFSQALTSETLLQKILTDAAAHYRFILCEIDTENTTLAMMIGPHISTAIYMAHTKKTTMHQAKRDLHSLQRLNINVVGTVLTD